MKTTLTIAAVALSMLSGCASMTGTHYIADTKPTAASVQAAGGSQRFQGAEVLATDFKADGTERSMADFDLTAEDAPCTVLGEVFTGVKPGRFGEFYSVKKGNETLMLNCRSVSAGIHAGARLYLIGSSYDCANRDGFTSAGYVSKFAHDHHKKCAAYRASSGAETAVDRIYKSL